MQQCLAWVSPHRWQRCSCCVEAELFVGQIFLIIVLVESVRDEVHVVFFLGFIKYSFETDELLGYIKHVLGIPLRLLRNASKAPL